MKQMTAANYQRAVDYLKVSARPLEKALYAHAFESGTAADVLRELAAFQNADGGFGHGLEPDVRLEDSSVICTTVALQHLRKLAVPVEHPMVAQACAYLAGTYEADEVNWHIIPANIDDAPHAPWWVYAGSLDKSLANPRAEIAGYLNDYADHFPAEMRQTVTQSVVDWLMTQPDELEMHDLYCYMRFWQTESLPAATRAQVFDKLKRVVDANVLRDADAMQGYGLTPLSVVDAPDSPFAQGLEDAISANLDLLITSQSETGGWMPNWTWDDRWPETWEVAKREWSVVLTLGNLRTLKAFGRVQG